MKKLCCRTSIIMSYCALFLGTANTAQAEKIGILFGSFGDVDKKEEIENFVKNAIMDPDVAPLPSFLRPLISIFGWEMKKKEIYKEYETIGWNTHFRTHAQTQAESVASLLQAQGKDVYGYTGLTFTFPFVRDTMRRIHDAGIERLIVLYQGAQYSKPTAGIVFREVRKYLNAHPNWKIPVTTVQSFSDDPRFQKVLGDSIEARINTDFPEVPNENICIFLPSHGNPMKYVEEGDPAYAQMLRVVDAMKTRFPDNHVYFGFQNHDEFPGKWTQPKVQEVAVEVGRDSCSNVIINGRTTFTIDSLETLYDHAINERNIILEEDPQKRVVVEPMFNNDPAFIQFTADLILDALNGKGDLGVLP